MSSCEFKEIIVFKDFETENGVLGLEGEYCQIFRFADIKKSMSKYFLFHLIFYLCFL
jgi:hypothetical protein